jgi:predicted MFS family arabinose efflux permease
LVQPIEEMKQVPQQSASFLRRTFQAFHFRDFRLMWIGACTSQVGTQIQTTAQSWTVLQLSHNPFYLGVDQFLGQIPIAVLALLAGVLADRRDRRIVLLGSQYTQLACAFIMATLAFTGVLRVWHIWCLSFVVGTAQAFGSPSYSALVPTLVPREHLPNAIALNSIQFNLARVIGPSIAGIALATLGAGWCFSLNGISFFAVIAMLYIIQVSFVPQRSSERVMDSMKQGIRFIGNHEGMKALIVLAFLITFLGFQSIAFLPVFASDVFHGKPTTYAAMLSFSGAGAVTGALLVAGLGNAKHQGRNALIALCVLGIFTTGFALSPSVPFSCAMIFLAGIALLSVFAMISSLIQLMTPDQMRGRVMSIFNLALRGGGPIGAIIAGALIHKLHAPIVIASAGGLMLCLGLFFLTIDRRVARL